MLTDPILMERGKLHGTLDKVKYGIPFKGRPTIWEQATILFKEMVENHYFADGNKRIGILITYIFLYKNGYLFQPPKGEVFSMTMAVAQVQKNFEEIQTWFIEHSGKLGDT